MVMRRQVVLLDGGVGQEIYRRAINVSHPLWSVAVMTEQPDVVTAVHSDFIRAGAKTLCLNTYTATPSRLLRSGMSEQIAAIHDQAYELLGQAVKVTGACVDIAGSLPPLSGSYQGAPERTFENLRDEYRILVKHQARADVLLIETMTNTLEASAASAAAFELGKPFSVAFRLESNGKLKSGETMAEAIAAVSPYSPAAVLLNCCNPELISAAMPELVKLFPCVGAYANAFKSVVVLAGGGSVDALEAREDVGPHAYVEYVRHWLNEGATVIGGCCEITPYHVRHIAETFKDEYEFIRFSQLPVSRNLEA